MARPPLPGKPLLLHLRSRNGSDAGDAVAGATTDDTTEEPRGRDVFVDGLPGVTPLTAAAVAALFAAAFDLPSARALTEDAPFEAQLAAWDGDHVLVYALEPWGDFPFKVAMDFTRPIEVARFAAMARAHGLTIAYAADERAAHDVRYHVVDRAGTTTRLLSFDETPTSYACNLAGGEPSAGGPRS